ncbi:MAG: uroporphyrinogen decarboxylase family protein [Bacteroidales bacterium]
MTSRSLVRQTLSFESPPRIPRQAWILPWAEIHHPREVARIRERYPDDCTQAPVILARPAAAVGGKYRAGLFIDEWGCRFSNREEGLMGIISEPRISDWADLESFTTPDILYDLDVEAINHFCRSTDRFVYSGGIIRPFERFQFLRTMEQSFMDLVIEETGYLELLSLIHQHYVKETEAWAQTAVDGIFLMDDWGTQHAMMVSPDVFRRHFKPMYAEYCAIARHYGKYVFMHSDGNIQEIIPDLIEVGVDALNSQLFCMDLDRLEREAAGRITFWGEIDRQELLPNGTPEAIDNAIDLIYNKLYHQGGLIAQCEFGPAANPANVERVFEAWSRKVGRQ